MSRLAIKGHATRGEEVIEILGMLGGSNAFNHDCDNPRAIYYIDEIYKNYVICAINLKKFVDYSIFTLEEFLEKFPYRVGDRVRVPEYESEVRISKMYWDGNEVQYEVVTDEVEWYSAAELNEFNEPNKETPMYLNEKANKQAEEIKKLLEPAKEIIEDIIKIDIPRGYEFTGIDNQQVVFEKIGYQYPKTYEECCSVLKIPNDERYIDVDVPLDYNKLLYAFTELLVCRNAYWKIAGEQMGLGKPWEPDWTNNYQKKWTINFYQGEINLTSGPNVHFVLVFPTAEMRDAFYDNFKDLIEQCKELL